MLPEEKSRLKIDQMLAEKFWQVVDRHFYSPEITAVALREGLLKGNLEADYLLFLNGEAIGVLEAKREEVNIYDVKVKNQVGEYARKAPNYYKVFCRPLPLLYISNGDKILFKDNRIENTDFIEIPKMHTPKEIVKILGITDIYAALPKLVKNKSLRDCQYEAITELEKSFKAGKDRALMVLATGAGKTFTACLIAYRLLTHTPMKRILFLVDRNNLGKQARTEFGTFKLTEKGEIFDKIYNVERLKSANLPQKTNVVISTIQRLFSLLKGEEIEDIETDDEDFLDAEISLPDNLKLPPDYFDLIIIDECHRSIYGNWKKVLDYFSTAKLIGLTATPVPETLAFFDNNKVVDYTLEKSIIDGVNVGQRVYRIKTEVTENGGAILEGESLVKAIKYTGKIETIQNKETKNYSKEELNRSVINPAQIKLILETYRDAVYTEMFIDPPREPNMDYLPKTLIFAINENHATNIVQIAKEVFGRNDNDFVQKITYASGDSDLLIRKFNNDKEFRIAVTCTLVATGTDIKPLEVVMFMRDVASEPLYIQMKGRGVRTINADILRNVTPNAHAKNEFFLVDAVGVTERIKTIAPLLEGAKSKMISFRDLLEKITHGNLQDDYLQLLANRISRIYHKSTQEQIQDFYDIAQVSMKEIATNIFSALEQEDFPKYYDINDENSERKALVAPLANNPKAREYLLILNAGFIYTQTLGTDTLISKGFSVEEAQNTISAFEIYCNEHKDEIEALRIIFNNRAEVMTYSMLKDLENKLKMANNHFSQSNLWNSYAIISPNSVRKATIKEEKEALTNIIQLVRFAFKQIGNLESLYPKASQRFNLWCGQVQRQISEEQILVIKQVLDYIASNGACGIKEIREDNPAKAAQLIKVFGNKDMAEEALFSLSQFIIYTKTA